MGLVMMVLAPLGMTRTLVWSLRGLIIWQIPHIIDESWDLSAHWEWGIETILRIRIHEIICTKCYPLSGLHLAPISTWQGLPWRNNLILQTRKNYSKEHKLNLQQNWETDSEQVSSHNFSTIMKLFKLRAAPWREWITLNRPIWVNYF